MAYDEALAERIRPLVEARGAVTERKMFGGITWMLRGNMACGVMGHDLCVRLTPDDAEQALSGADTRPFEMMAGRPAKGMVVVDGAAVAAEDALARWVNAGADYALSLPPKLPPKGRERAP
jgi:TfoX/Sxy family transcriptional regulator of competence genes